MSEERTSGKHRGRPPGTGLDDTADLTAVAERIVASEGSTQRVSPTAAMRQCVRSIGESHLRRLQVKWKADGARLLAEARERNRARKEASEAAARTTAARSSARDAYAALHLAASGTAHPALGGMGRLDPALASAMTLPPGLAEVAKASANLGMAPGLHALEGMRALQNSLEAVGLLSSSPALAGYKQLMGGLVVAGQLQAVTDQLRIMKDLADPPILRQMRGLQGLMDYIGLQRRRP